MGVSKNNELRADLKVTGTQQFKRDLNEAGDSARKAGDGLEEMAKDAGFLAKSIADAQEEIKALVAQLDATGDMTLLKGIRAEKRSLRLFENLAKEIAEPAEEAGEVFTEHLVKTIEGGGPVLKIALGGLILAAAPFVGATIAAAVLGGVGLGGIAGGIAMSVTDPQVQSAAADLASTVGEAFKDAGQPFAAPVVEALGILKAEGVSAARQFADAFKVIMPVLPQLTQGIGGLVREIMPGFTKGLESAKPVLRMLASELPKVGDAISDMFESIAEDPQGAILALGHLLKLTNGLIRATGEFVGWLSKAYEFSFRMSHIIIGGAEEALGWIPGVGDMISSTAAHYDELALSVYRAKDGSHDFSGTLGEVEDSAHQAAKELEVLKTAMDELFGNTMDLHQAQLNYEKSWDETIEILKDGKRTLDANTEAGRENRGALLDNIAALKEIYDANIANGMAIDDANAIYDQHLEKLRAAAIQTGFNRNEINQLIDAYDKLPQLVELQLTVKGLHGAVAQVEALTALLGTKAAAKAHIEGTYVSGRASGGDVRAGKTYMVGEKGPELVTFGSDGYVHDASATAAMMSASAGGGGLMTAARPVVNISYAGSGNPQLDAVVDLLWPFIIHRVRIDGGDPGSLGA